jgi:hypothetical protein
MIKQRPKVFIGSSTEGLSVAGAVQEELDHDCEVVMWTQGVFDLTQGTLESLDQKLKSYDFAIFVLTPDDRVTKRGETKACPRDNVLFELGMFVGGLGRDRTFMVFDRNCPLEMPSDLSGVTKATFAPHSYGDLRAALGAPCNQIRAAIRKTGLLKTYGEYAVSAQTVRNVIGIGNCEPTGLIKITQVSERNSSGRIYISYGGANVTIPWHRIKIEGTGVLSLAKLDEDGSSHSPGLLNISVPEGGCIGDSISIEGVRVQINGLGLNDLRATVSMEGNAIRAGHESALVIANTNGVGISSVKAKKCFLDSDDSTCHAVGEIRIKEGFLGAFVGWENLNAETKNSTEFRLTISGLLTGMEMRIEDNLPNIRTEKFERTEDSATFHLILLKTYTRAKPNIITIPYQIDMNFPLSTESVPCLLGTISLAPIAGPFIFSESTGKFDFPEDIPRYAALESRSINLLEF